MAEQVPRSVLLWRAWALAGVIAVGVSGARFRFTQHLVTASAPARSSSAKAVRTPHIEVEMLLPSAVVGDALLARLRASETANEECELLRRLPASDEPKATYAIAEVLERTRFRSVRACATSALTLQPTPEAQSWLVDLAADPDPDVHDAALTALADHGDGPARAVVIEAAHSEDIDIRASAVGALLAAHQLEALPAAMALLGTVDRLETLASLVDALGKSSDARAAAVLQNVVAHADTETHLRAISALGDLGQQQAVARLTSLLEVGSDDEYDAAAKALATLSPESALGRLEATLHSSNGDRRATALTAILASNLAGVEPILKNALIGDDVRLTRTALQHVARAPDASLEPQLSALLARDDRQVQRLAIRALGRLHTPSSVETLQKAASSDALGAWARSELDRIPGEPDETRARHIRELEHGFTRALGSLAADPTEAAQAAVLGYFAKAPESAAELQGVVQTAPASTVERLLASTVEGATKQAVIDGLVARGDPRFVAVLRSAAHDDNDDVRRSALRGLVQLGDDDSTRLLEGLAKGAEPAERGLAAELLGARPDADAVPLLESLAGDSDITVASAALGQLRAREPERAAALAKRAYQTASAEGRTTLLSGLGSSWGESARPIYELAVQDSDDNVVSSGLHSLGDLQGADGARRLLAVATDERRSSEVRTIAAQALRMLGGPLVRENRALLDTLAPLDETEIYVCNSR